MTGSIRRKIQKSLKQRGFLGTVGLCLKASREILKDYSPSQIRAKSVERHFDRKFGVHTRGVIDLSDRNIYTEDWKWKAYMATPLETFHVMLKNIQIQHDNFIFVDFGSGKGRTLLLASAFPFKKIIGIELVADLHRIAQENIKNYERMTLRKRGFECICLDAAHYQIPPDPAVLYFFNPFPETVMAHVLSNIEKSLVEHPREIWVMYNNPVLGHLFDNACFLEKVKAADTGTKHSNFAVYRSRLGSRRLPSASVRRTESAK